MLTEHRSSNIEMVSVAHSDRTVRWLHAPVAREADGHQDRQHHAQDKLGAILTKQVTFACELDRQKKRLSR
jgi:hypothetical protein